MPCNVQKVTTTGTVTCDNAGTSSHTGQHSGVISSFFGLVNRRVWWTSTDTAPAYRRNLVIGDKG